MGFEHDQRTNRKGGYGEYDSDHLGGHHNQGNYGQYCPLSFWPIQTITSRRKNAYLSHFDEVPSRRRDIDHGADASDLSFDDGGGIGDGDCNDGNLKVAIQV